MLEKLYHFIQMLISIVVPGLIDLSNKIGDKLLKPNKSDDPPTRKTTLYKVYSEFSWGKMEKTMGVEETGWFLNLMLEASTYCGDVTRNPTRGLTYIQFPTNWAPDEAVVNNMVQTAIIGLGKYDSLSVKRIF